MTELRNAVPEKRAFTFHTPRQSRFTQGGLGMYREIYVEIYVPVTNFEIWIYHESW